MNKRSFGPTVFLPAPRRRGDSFGSAEPAGEPATAANHIIILRDADFWEEDSLPFDRSDPPPPRLPAMTRTVRRSRPESATARSTAVTSSHLDTIRTYLQKSFLGEPVCVLTQAGRFHGQLQGVGRHDLTLLTDQGQLRNLALDGLLSVAYARSRPSSQTFKNA